MGLQYMMKVTNIIQGGTVMPFQKPMILYYDKGNTLKRNAIEKSILPLGITLVPIAPSQFLQTVGHLAKVKGFPARKLSPLEVIPEITEAAPTARAVP